MGTTPHLRLDVAVLDRNIAAMAGLAVPIAIGTTLDRSIAAVRKIRVQAGVLFNQVK